MIGDFLFALTSRDQQLTPLQVVYEQQANLLGAVSQFQQIYRPPISSVLVVTTAHAHAANDTATPTVSCGALAIFIRPSGDTGFTSQRFARVADSINRSGQRFAADILVEGPIYVMPGWELVAQSVWSGTTESRVLRSGLTGLLIPRGNFAQGQVELATA